jgi:Bifunctional DNA primase/polymerase, N-terminal/Protein of unknown function (DUF3987)
MNNLHEAAREYCGYGWRIIPTKGKAPCGGVGWPSKATSDAGEAMAMIDDTQADGIGVLLRASGLIDLDADSPEAEQAIQRLFGGDIPQTPTYRSARGLHRLFEWRDGWGNLSSKAKVMAGPIEIRGIGERAAQSVFPPSGGREWVISPADCPLAVLSDQVVAELVRMATPAKPQAKPIVDHPRAGGQLDVRRWLDRVGAVLLEVDHGADGTKKWFVECPGIASHSTKNASRDCCITQEPSGRMGGCCFHSSCGMTDWQAISNALGRPTPAEWGIEESDPHWAAIAERLMAGEPPQTDAEPIQPVSEPPPPKAAEFPADCLTPPGLLGQIVEHTLAVSLYPQPELALAAAIGCVATLCGHKITDPQNTRSNIYLIGLDETSSGKDIGRRVVSRLLAAVEPRLRGPETLNSSSAVVSALKVSPILLMLLDEAGYLFKAAANPNATHMGQLVPTLLKLFTSSGELVNLSSYTDSQKNADIDQPNLSIYATGTPDGFWEHLNTSNISDGLMGRMLVVPGRGYQQVRETEWIDLPESMIEAARWWWKWLPGEAADHMLSPAPVKLQRSKAAYDRFWQYFRDISARRIGEDLTRAAIWSRAPEKANKLALIHCASRHVCTEPKSIEFEDIDWAIKVVNYLTRQLIAGCERYVSRNQQEQTVKRVLRIIGDAGEKGLSQHELTRKLQWLPRKTRSELIADLVESGQVQAARTETGGRPKCKYRLSAHPTKGNPH